MLNSLTILFRIDRYDSFDLSQNTAQTSMRGSMQRIFSMSKVVGLAAGAFVLLNVSALAQTTDPLPPPPPEWKPGDGRPVWSNSPNPTAAPDSPWRPGDGRPPWGVSKGLTPPDGVTPTDPQGTTFVGGRPPWAGRPAWSLPGADKSLKAAQKQERRTLKQNAKAARGNPGKGPK
jgi:hypothetical protein